MTDNQVMQMEIVVRGLVDLSIKLTTLGSEAARIASEVRTMKNILMEEKEEA